MRLTTKVILITVLLFILATGTIFFLRKERKQGRVTEDQSAIEKIAREKNLVIQHVSGVDKNCLNYIPKVSLQSSPNETNQDEYLLKLVVSYDKKAGDTIFSGVLERKKENWEVFSPLSKRFFTFKDVKLPLEVEELLMAVNKDLLDQGYQSVRVKYSLEVLGCAEVTGYANEINIKEFSK